MQDKDTEVKEVEQPEQTIVVQSVEDDMRNLGIGVDEVQKADGEKEPEGAIEDKDTKDEEKPKKPTRAERRIKKQQAKIRQLEEQLSKKETIAEDTKPPKEVKEPSIDDFDDYEDYEKAKAEFEENNKSVKVEQKQEDKKQVPQIDDELVAETLEYGKDKYDDFEQVVMTDELALTEDMLEVALDSDLSEDILYYLGSNRELALEIAGKSPKQVAKEIGKIEAKLESGWKPKSAKKETKAPEPIKPVGGSGTKPKSLDDEDLSYEEYEALLNKQRRKSFTGFL